MPGRQRVCGSGWAGPDGADLPGNAAQFHLGGCGQHHGAGSAARSASVQRAGVPAARAGPSARLQYCARSCDRAPACGVAGMGQPCTGPAIGPGTGAADAGGLADACLTACHCPSFLRCAPGRGLGPDFRHPGPAGGCPSHPGACHALSSLLRCQRSLNIQREENP